MDIFEYKDAYQYQSSRIQPQDMHVLERIYYLAKVKIKDISKHCNIPPSTLTGIIDRLEAKKYIQRLKNTDDRRSIELIITEIGKQAADKHIREDEQFSHNFFSGLPLNKKELFKEMLNELLHNMKKEDLFKESNI